MRVKGSRIYNTARRYSHGCAHRCARTWAGVYIRRHDGVKREKKFFLTFFPSRLGYKAQLVIMEKIYILSINTRERESATKSKRFLGAYETREEAYFQGRDYIMMMSGENADVKLDRLRESNIITEVGAIFYFDNDKPFHTKSEHVWIDSVFIKEGTAENIKAAASLAADENFKAQYPTMWESAVDFIEHL